MVVVDRLAGNVGVLTGRQIEPLDRTQIGEQVEGPEDRGSPDAEPLHPGVDHEIRRREVAGLVRDQPGHRPPWLGQAVTRTVEGVDQGRRITHGQMIHSLS